MSKTKALLFTSMLLLAAAPVCAQNYELRSITIQNGGGISAGGAYSFNHTIGQPVAGAATGGSYTFQVGSWNIVRAIQTPGAPLLTIRLVGNNQVIVSWPASASGFTLQRTSTMNPPVVWTDVTTPPTASAGYYSVAEPIGVGQTYFRLRQTSR